MPNSPQLKLSFPARRGRPPKPQKVRNSYIWHRSRPEMPKNIPVHVTLKSDRTQIPTLRNKALFREIRQAMRRARLQGIRIIEFSVQTDHIHLLLEPQNKVQLGKSMRAMSISLSKRLTFLLGKKVKAFKERYHLHVLRSFTEVRNAVHYVRSNGKKHRVATSAGDWYSTAFPRPKMIWTQELLDFFDELHGLLSSPGVFIQRALESTNLRCRS
jgi:REP element-mobilizing transposase RayT